MTPPIKPGTARRLGLDRPEEEVTVISRTFSSPRPTIDREALEHQQVSLLDQIRCVTGEHMGTPLGMRHPKDI